jgi:hypothetical protein
VKKRKKKKEWFNRGSFGGVAINMLVGQASIQSRTQPASPCAVNSSFTIISIYIIYMTHA